MNNDDILKSQIPPTPPVSTEPTPPPIQDPARIIIPNQTPTPIPDHPLDILRNQSDPYSKAKDLPSQKPIRTYESDVADILAKQKSSIISMASAENERKLSEKAAREKLQSVNEESNKKEEVIETIKHGNRTKKVFLTLVSLVFVVAGLLGGAYFYLNSPIAPAPTLQTPIKIPSIINPDIQNKISLDAVEKTETSAFIASTLRDAKTEEGTILEIVPVRTVGTTTEKITGSEFIDSSELRMPDILRRSITDKWMTGVYEKEGNNLPFIIFTSDFFQNTFAGMLKWENTMPDELVNLLNYSDKINSVSASSSISTFGAKGSFTDKIIKNRDIREFVNTKGETLFLYTFLDQETVIITSSEAVIPEIVDRIEKQTYIR